MKNTVYVLAREEGVGSIERFGTLLARHFVDRYEQVEAATIELEEELWRPIATGGAPAPDAFERVASERGVATVTFDGDRLAVESGIEDLRVLKSAHSAFVDFHRDRYTTLPDVADRILATSVGARWSYEADWSEAIDHRALRDELRAILVDVFARHESLSVQQTLLAMAAAAIEQLPALGAITLVLPNQHHLLVNLLPFGLDNPNVVFVGTDEPFGRIEATVAR
jgi:urate oxidase